MQSQDLTIYQGETYSLPLTVLDANGAVQNLSGYGVSGYVKTSYSNSGKLVDLGIVVTSTGSGIITLNIPATGTQALPTNISFYDINIMASGTTTVTKAFGGKVYTYPGATW